jgi:hypothetical protein
MGPLEELKAFTSLVTLMNGDIFSRMNVAVDAKPLLECIITQCIYFAQSVGALSD